MRQRSENPGTFLNEATRSLRLIVAPQAHPAPRRRDRTSAMRRPPPGRSGRARWHRPPGPGPADAGWRWPRRTCPPGPGAGRGRRLGRAVLRAPGRAASRRTATVRARHNGTRCIGWAYVRSRESKRVAGPATLTLNSGPRVRFSRAEPNPATATPGSSLRMRRQRARSGSAR